LIYKTAGKQGREDKSKLQINSQKPKGKCMSERRRQKQTTIKLSETQGKINGLYGRPLISQ